MELLPCLLVTVGVMAEIPSPGAPQDLEYWMSDLPPRLKNEPIIYLAIPESLCRLLRHAQEEKQLVYSFKYRNPHGSHNTMSYGITRSSELAPDAPPALSRLFPIFKGTMVRWSRTQAADVTHQLVLGIRYLDLRVATKQGTDRFYFTHGMYAGEISGPLIQIREFLDSHPQEVVILDFQHFYGMTQEDHGRLIAALVNVYGARVCPYRTDLESVTLNTLYRSNMQIIIVYRHAAVYTSERLWRPEQLPTLWPQQDTVSGLLRYLTALRRHAGAGFVHQAVLTPTTSFIVLRWVSNLREQCAKPVEQHVFPVLGELAPGAPRPGGGTPVNVVIADFVEMNRAEFSKMIVALNYKLLGGNMLCVQCPQEG